MVAYRYILKGRVQGVGFRFFTCQCAHNFGIGGWVRNLSNGDVEVHAEGEKRTLNQFLAQVESGPPLALVSDIEVRGVQTKNYPQFSVQG